MKWILILILCLTLIGCATLDKIVNSGSEIADQAKDVVAVIAPNTNWAVTGLTALVAVFGFYKKWRANQKLGVVIEGVEKVKSGIAEGKYAEAVNDILRNVAVAYNLYPEIKADVKKIRENLKA